MVAGQRCFGASKAPVAAVAGDSKGYNNWEATDPQTAVAGFYILTRSPQHWKFRNLQKKGPTEVDPE